VSRRRSSSAAASAARIFGGGISRHGSSCGCPYCRPEQRYVAAQPAPESPHATPETSSSDREYLLDVASAAQHDSWDLAGNRGLIESICRDYVMLGAQAERDAETIAELKRRLAELTAAAQEANRDAAAALERERVAYREQSRIIDAAYNAATKETQET